MAPWFRPIRMVLTTSSRLALVSEWPMTSLTTSLLPSLATTATKPAGLCGDFDGDPSNDLRLPDGNVTQDVNVFRSAWKVDVPGAVCEDGCEGDACLDCNPRLKASLWEASLLRRSGWPQWAVCCLSCNAELLNVSEWLCLWCLCFWW